MELSRAVNWGIVRKVLSEVGQIAHPEVTALCLLLVLVAPATGTANQPPVVDSMTADPATVAPGELVTVTVTAHDPDCPGVCTTECGQAVRADLTRWLAVAGVVVSESNGSDGSPYSATAQWQAPPVEDAYTLEVELSDNGTWMCGDRQTVVAGVTVVVGSGSNRPPVVESVTADPARVLPGQVSTLTCVASDPDGDPLSFSWATDLGTVTPGAGGSAQLLAGTPGVATVACTVTDPSGAPASGTTLVSVSDVAPDRAVRTGLAAPHRVAVDSSASLYVADRAAGGVQVLHLETGRPMYRIPVAGVTSVDVDWNDHLVLGTRHGARVADRTGATMLPLGLQAGEVSDVAADAAGQRYAVLYRSTGRVVVYGPTGAQLGAFGSTGDAPDQLRGPSGVAFAPGERVAVADTGHGLVKVFGIDGTLVQTIGGFGGGPGEAVELDDVAVDTGGVIWTSDAFQGWVQSFNPDGSLREVAGTWGDGDGELRTAAGIAIAEPWGKLLVASVNTSAVQVFQLGEPGVVDWPAPAAAVDTTSLVFPPQAVATSSAPRAVVLSNTGDAPLGVVNLSSSGPFVAAGDCAVVESGGSCTYQVVFRPPTEGVQSGQLRLAVSSDDAPLLVTLSGTGYLPAGAVLEPAILDFPVQPVGKTSESLTAVLHNPGSVALDIHDVSVQGPFSLVSTCGWQLAGGSSCVVRVEFSPVGVGDANGSVTVVSSAPGSPHRVLLSGRGERFELALDPAAVDFGFIAVGSAGPVEPVHVVNTGTAPLSVGAVALAGASAADFTLAADQCSGAVVAQDEGCWLQLGFAPSEVGPRSAVVRIPTDVGLEVTVDLRGGDDLLFADGFESGDTAAWGGARAGKSLRLVPAVLDFGGAARTADGDVHAVEVSNDGEDAAWIGALRLEGEDATRFVLVDDGCSGRWLSPGESCAFRVRMLAGGEGGSRAEVVVPAEPLPPGRVLAVRLAGDSRPR